LKLASTDDDYFAVDLASGDTLNATVTHLESYGTVELSIIDPSGSTTPGKAIKPFASEQIERAAVNAQGTGTHYVRVSASDEVALKYNLTINTSAAKILPVTPVLSGETFTFDSIDTGQWYHRDVPSPEELDRAVDFERIGIKPERPGRDLAVTVDVTGEVPEGVSEPSGESVMGDQYLEIQPGEEYTGATSVEATVPLTAIQESGVAPGDLRILHLRTGESGNRWRTLSTSVEDSDGERVSIRATSKGGGVYAVSTVSNEIYDLFVENKATYNDHLSKAPSFVSKLAGSRINVDVDTQRDGSETVGVVLEGKRVQRIERGGLEDPELVVETSESALRTINTADRPAEAAGTALREDRISYHGVGLVNTVKYTGIKIAVGGLELLGDTFGIGPFG
jgi:hypothetical protein